MHELDKSLKIISVSGDSLLILGTSAVFIKTQVTGKKKTLLQCAVLRRNKNPEILVSLENMKRLGIVHPTFGRQTINQFSSKYSERYQANSIQYYQPTKSDIKEPSKEEKELRENFEIFVEKLGKNDRISCPPVSLEVDPRKAEQMRPVNHIKPYDVPFHLRAGYEKEVLDMVDAGIIATCDVATLWNTKAFLVAKSDGTNWRIVGDWRGVNSILK